MNSRISGRRIAAGMVIAALAGSIALACAGGDYEELGWDAQGSNALLSPTNDTRANLILLMADRDGTLVADPRTMASGIVPFNTSYEIFQARLFPPRPKDQPEPATDEAAYGLSPGKELYDYASDMIGLCHTNRSGAAQFNAALAADRTVPEAERTQLNRARNRLANACDKAGEIAFAYDNMTSPAGRAYAAYLDASRLFYAEQTGAAADAFAAIGPKAPSWVAETASYMRMRALLAQAISSNIDEWGAVIEPDRRDQAATNAAAEARRVYLTAYPHGRYAQSARDLGRRIAWVSGDAAALGAVYSQLVEDRMKPTTLPDVATVQEIDRKLLPSKAGAGVTDPALLAVIDLMRLRPVEKYDQDRACCGPLLTRAELDRQKPLFARQADLYSYLLAVEAFTSRKQMRDVIALIPDAAHQARFSYLQFSRQMLRGFALEAVKDPNARGFWLSLLPGARQPYQAEAVQLAILQHDRAAGIVGRLLETGSPVVHPLMRSAIIEKDSGIDLLRRMTKDGINDHERDTALYVLLANELHFGMYRDFLVDQQRLGPARPAIDDDAGWSVDSYSPDWDGWPGSVPLDQFARGKKISDVCPTLRDTATSLAANAGAIQPLMCLAEYIRGNGFDTWNMAYQPETGGYRSLPRAGFRGTPVTRATIYQRVMVSPAANDDQRAFALNRAIRCYEPSGGNDCGGDDVPKATRKAWFTRLKTQYPVSRWAKELKYYW